MNDAAHIIGICRHRLTTDGEGVTTLVAFHGCP
ncbi:MAG: radical SAM protein, partial [Muribaculaceae bacterium]|nr:radical SAM protein [Muribaculaceae bacterium]